LDCYEVRSFAQNPPDRPVAFEVEECVQLSGIIVSQGGGFSFWGGDFPSE